MGCCGGGIDWGREVNSWNETAGWLQALPRGKMLALGWKHWDALVGANFKANHPMSSPLGPEGWHVAAGICSSGVTSALRPCIGCVPQQLWALSLL